MGSHVQLNGKLKLYLKLLYIKMTNYSKNEYVNLSVLIYIINQLCWLCFVFILILSYTQQDGTRQII
jgi:uncharacterized membrane protein